MDKVPTNKRGLVTSQDLSLDKEYIEWIHELKSRFRNSQIKAAVKVNSEQLLFNWQLGRDLVVRKAEEKWGTGIVNQVSLDLQAEFPEAKGFSARNLWNMKKWYLFYAENDGVSDILQTFNSLINTESEKLQQVAAEIHEKPDRQKLKQVVAEKLPPVQGALAKEIIKSNYDFGFVSLPDGFDEDALEGVLEQRMTRFLLELGEGWAFVGRQKEIIIAGKTRKIDLLFYHIYLRCYVVLELKVKPFDPEFAGKLNFYVNAVNEFVKRDSDNPSIGLLICKDMDRTEVQLAFQGITTPMGVATYDNVKIKEIQEYLPTAEQIQRQIALAEEEYKMQLATKE